MRDMDAYTTFARRSARTRRFTLGLPRSVRSVATKDGPAAYFLRAATGDDPVNQLVRLDLSTGQETVVVDPYALAVDDTKMTAEERAQRERLREQAGGVTSFDMTKDGTTIVFTLGGELFTTVTPYGAVEQRNITGAFDPRISPDGARVAFCRDGGVAVLDCDTGTVTALCHGQDTISYGRAEFIAAEEMGRSRGHWWLNATTLLVAKVDEAPVDVWHISDPSRPNVASRPVRYPAAGTANAAVSLLTIDVPSGTATPVVFAHSHPYIAQVNVTAHGTVILCQSRNQQNAYIYRLDPQTAGVTLLRTVSQTPWVELVSGVPRLAGDSLITVEDRVGTSGGYTRQVCIDGEPIGPDTLYVRDVIAVTGTDVTVHASDQDATVIAPYVLARDGSRNARRIAFPQPVDDGIHHLVAPYSDNGWWVHTYTGMADTTTRYLAVPARDAATTHMSLTVTAHTPGFHPNVTFLTLGENRLNAALILPDGLDVDARIPVLLDPYGGPHAQRVLRHAGMYLSSAWFAAQGFAVLIIDGRGTPGRDPAFEHAVDGNFAVTLDDQIAGLIAAADIEQRLDLDRVAIRGWSFGGYLAALAVLRRPDIFRAAVAGAPVTHWQWYDTHYTERYLGEPATNPDAYSRSNLITDGQTLVSATDWDDDNPPALLLIHGLADDNVVAAHTLALSAALLADNRAHQVLPLSGVTHMTPQEQVAEALLTQQARFLQQALAVNR